MIERIKDHQQLLERYYRAEALSIWEFSSGIESDLRELKEIVTDYARQAKLDASFMDKDDR